MVRAWYSSYACVIHTCMVVCGSIFLSYSHNMAYKVFVVVARCRCVDPTCVYSSIGRCRFSMFAVYACNMCVHRCWVRLVAHTCFLVCVASSAKLSIVADLYSFRHEFVLHIDTHVVRQCVRVHVCRRVSVCDNVCASACCNPRIAPFHQQNEFTIFSQPDSNETVVCPSSNCLRTLLSSIFRNFSKNQFPLFCVCSFSLISEARSSSFLCVI